MSKKEYVEVILCFNSYGLVPAELIWKHKTHYSIDRVIHTCKCIDSGRPVLRHTVLIGGKQKYIYCDENNRWYVNVAG